MFSDIYYPEEENIGLTTTLHGNVLPPVSLFPLRVGKADTTRTLVEQNTAFANDTLTVDARVGG